MRAEVQIHLGLQEVQALRGLALASVPVLGNSFDHPTYLGVSGLSTTSVATVSLAGLVGCTGIAGWVGFVDCSGCTGATGCSESLVLLELIVVLSLSCNGVQDFH